MKLWPEDVLPTPGYELPVRLPGQKTLAIASHGERLARLMQEAGFRYVFLGIGWRTRSASVQRCATRR